MMIYGFMNVENDKLFGLTPVPMICCQSEQFRGVIKHNSSMLLDSYIQVTFV